MYKIVWVLSILAGANSLIVPNELPTILSLVYSNIPTIKKGTDSRVGWGFRLGDRADIQVLVELGPQTNTQPLGDQPGASTSKRNAPNSLANILYAQRQHEKAHFSNTDGGKWLKEWSQNMRQGPLLIPTPSRPQRLSFRNVQRPNVATKTEENENTVLGIGEIDARSVIPEDTEDKILKTKSTTAPKTTTSKEDALDNVSMDD